MSTNIDEVAGLLQRLLNALILDGISFERVERWLNQFEPFHAPNVVALPLPITIEGILIDMGEWFGQRPGMLVEFDTFLERLGSALQHGLIRPEDLRKLLEEASPPK